jgi:hypothetical protein
MRKQSFVSLSTDNILKCICEVQLIFINECDLVYADSEGFFPFQTMHTEDVHIGKLSKLC